MKLLEQATRRDPTFVLAWCALSKTQCDSFDPFDPGPARLEWARKAADTALRLRPDLGEVHRELARCYLLADDFASAYEELTVALRTLPNDSETFRIAAETDRHRNRWDEALANLQKARALDPRNGEVTYYIGNLYEDMRRYDAWERLSAEETAIHPEAGPWYDPTWDSLRGDPRFEKIIASLAPSAAA